MDGINHLHQHPPGRNRTLSPVQQGPFFFSAISCRTGKEMEGKDGCLTGNPRACIMVKHQNSIWTSTSLGKPSNQRVKEERALIAGRTPVLDCVPLMVRREQGAAMLVHPTIEDTHPPFFPTSPSIRAFGGDKSYVRRGGGGSGVSWERLRKAAWTDLRGMYFARQDDQVRVMVGQMTGTYLWSKER
jgi:hypothetical protein